MTEPTDKFDENLRDLAKAFSYPRTPDVARAVTRRLSVEPRPNIARPQLARLALALALVLALALAVPQVRAGIIRFLQIGGVRIVLPQPTTIVTVIVPVTATPAPVTPAPIPNLIPSLENLFGSTTLAGAQSRAEFELSLPTYPADLGEPDRVFFQRFGGEPMIIFVWLDPQQPERVRLSLHILACRECATKLEPQRLATTSVNGQPAVWAEGPYLLQLRNGNLDVYRLIDGQVLIWADAPLTYRLETDLSMEEAVKIAESLKPLDK